VSLMVLPLRMLNDDGGGAPPRGALVLMGDNGGGTPPRGALVLWGLRHAGGRLLS